jgi:hypothetical protein
MVCQGKREQAGATAADAPAWYMATIRDFLGYRT